MLQYSWCTCISIELMSHENVSRGPRATHIVAIGKQCGRFVVHPGTIHTHKKRVNKNAECDEQVHEGVHDEQFYVARKLVPAGRTLPSKEDLEALLLQPCCFGDLLPFSVEACRSKQWHLRWVQSHQNLLLCGCSAACTKSLRTMRSEKKEVWSA